MDLFELYGLTRVINACGKMTTLSGAIVLPEIAEAAAESRASPARSWISSVMRPCRRMPSTQQNAPMLIAR